MRPNHLHLMIEAPGFRKLITAWYPAGDEWLASDAVFGTKKSLVVVSVMWATVLPDIQPKIPRRSTRRSRTRRRPASEASAQATHTSLSTVMSYWCQRRWQKRRLKGMLRQRRRMRRREARSEGLCLCTLACMALELFVLVRTRVCLPRDMLLSGCWLPHRNQSW